MLHLHLQIEESGDAAGAPRRRGLAFAPSVLEEDDTYGELANYEDGDDGKGSKHLLLDYHHEVVSSDDDADVPPDTVLHAPVPARLEGHSSRDVLLLQARQGTMGNDSFIAGFVRGEAGREWGLLAGTSSSLQPSMRWAVAQHVFTRPSSHWYGALRDAGHVEALAQVDAPRDDKLRRRLDMMAAMVARGGQGVLTLVQQTHAGVLPQCLLHYLTLWMRCRQIVGCQTSFHT